MTAPKAMSPQESAEDPLAQLEARISTTMERWRDEPFVKAFARLGYAIIVSPERPPNMGAICERPFNRIVVYSHPASDIGLEKMLRHEIAHALGFEHGEAMRELGL